MKLERPKKIGAPPVKWVSPPKVKAKGKISSGSDRANSLAMGLGLGI